MQRARPASWGGLALMLGALAFLPVKMRYLIDPNDSLLGIYLFAGFTFWLIGLVALLIRYWARTGLLGKAGLFIVVAGGGLLAFSQISGFMFPGEDFWMFLVFGALGLTIGALIFGIAALRGDVLPRCQALPLVIGFIGLAWFVFGDSNRTTFLVLRTLFGLSWLLLGYVVWSDNRTSAAPGGVRGSNIDDERVLLTGS